MTEDVPTIAEDTLQRLSHRMLPMLSMSTEAVVYCYYRDDTGQPALYPYICNTNIPGGPYCNNGNKAARRQGDSLLG